MQNTAIIDTDTLDHVVQVAKAAGDTLRAGILQVLNNESYGVLELGRIFAMAQPAISHHLRVLSEAGLVSKRKEGTSIFYQRTNALGEPLLQALFAEIDAKPVPSEVQKQIKAVYRDRQHHTSEYFATRTDALTTQQELICAPTVYTAAVLEAAGINPAAAPPRGRDGKPKALEIGPGGGDLLTQLSPHCDSVLAIDNSAEMLAEAASAAASLPNVELQQQDFADFQTTTGFDLVLATMVLHHQPSPSQFFRQVQALLKPDGIFVIAELCAHGHEWVKQHCGDFWLGFSAEQLSHWAAQVGLTICHHQYFAQRNGFTVQVVAFRPPGTSD